MKREFKNQDTNILDKIRPGKNPARTGTSAVASDQVKTPISRTFLQEEDTSQHNAGIMLKANPKQRPNTSDMLHL